MLNQFKKDNLTVRLFQNRQELGNDAARLIAVRMKDLLNDNDQINMVFGAAPSQSETLEGLIKDPEIDWSRVNGFHMDEYVELDKDAPQGFGNFLKERLFDLVPFKSVHYINGNATDLEKECDRYALLLQAYPTDIVCMGIGENTHIAFNDPHVARFNDSRLVKVVDLDMQCRQQQVNDGCFFEISEVPTQAITLTVPALFKAAYAFCMVPGETKSNAVYLTLKNEVEQKYPATILKTHPNAVLFIDQDSGKLLVD